MCLELNSCRQMCQYNHPRRAAGVSHPWGKHHNKGEIQPDPELSLLTNRNNRKFTDKPLLWAVLGFHAESPHTGILSLWSLLVEFKADSSLVPAILCLPGSHPSLWILRTAENLWLVCIGLEENSPALENSNLNYFHCALVCKRMLGLCR